MRSENLGRISEKGEKPRVLFDTNVYGKIIEENLFEFVERLRKKDKAVIYGNQVIRKELRKIPRNALTGTKKIRMAALNLFDLLVGRHVIEITELTNFLALSYAKEYTGIVDKSLFNDFLIVASASLKELDIVCSEDQRTMCSKHAKALYKKVNKANDLRTPKLIPLKKFEAMLK